MSYPLLTRLGLSQFWYKHWYASLRSTARENIQHDIIIETLLELYLNYGLTAIRSPLAHEYWFTKLRKRSDLLQPNLNKFYRRFYYTNDILSIEHSFLIRHVTGEHFPLRTWLLKYHNWVILSFKCFKPNKSSRLRASASAQSKLDFISTMHVSNKNRLNTPVTPLALQLKRLKLLTFFLKNKRYSPVNTYSF